MTYQTSEVERLLIVVKYIVATETVTAGCWRYSNKNGKVVIYSDTGGIYVYVVCSRPIVLALNITPTGHVETQNLYACRWALAVLERYTLLDDLARI